MNKEPVITVCGIILTNAQAMAVRVALSSNDFDCGTDLFGLKMQHEYINRAKEVLHIMFLNEKKERELEMLRTS